VLALDSFPWGPRGFVQNLHPWLHIPWAPGARLSSTDHTCRNGSFGLRPRGAEGAGATATLKRGSLVRGTLAL
jgi:hypothetical protein